MDGANYNLLAILLVLIGMYVYLKFLDKKYFNIYQGIIIFLIFLAKQNIGIYYICAIFVYELIMRENLKSFIIKQLKKISVFLVCFGVFCIYLIINNNFYGFINYAFGGLFDFGNNNVAFSTSIHLLLYCLAAVFIIFFVNKYGKKIDSDNFLKKFNLLACVAFFQMFSCYPIFNTAHLLYVLIFCLLILFYFLDKAMFEDLFGEEKYHNPCYVFASLILLVLLIRFGLVYKDLTDLNVKINDEMSKYNNIYISKEYNEKVNVLKEYINEKNKKGVDVIVLSYEASMVMVELNKNNGDFDVAFEGNLGYDGENNLISEIEKMENTEILIFTDEKDCFWQESKKIREYIINNLNKDGEILNYSIYKCN